MIHVCRQTCVNSHYGFVPNNVLVYLNVVHLIVETHVFSSWGIVQN